MMRLNRSLCFAFLLSFLRLTIALGDDQPILLSAGGDAWADLPELQKAAAQGKPSALAALGEMILTGDGVPKDVPGAIKMLDQAAKAGESRAAFRLGKIYEEGVIVPVDPKKAFDYYHQAAFAGVSEAQYNLGAMYVSGRGLSRDYKEGLAWIIEATKHGANADGEKRVRDRLTSTHRADIIPAAEQRATELEVELTRAAPASANAGPPAPSKPSHAELPPAISNH